MRDIEGKSKKDFISNPDTLRHSFHTHLLIILEQLFSRRTLTLKLGCHCPNLSSATYSLAALGKKSTALIFTFLCISRRSQWVCLIHGHLQMTWEVLIKHLTRVKFMNAVAVIAFTVESTRQCALVIQHLSYCKQEFVASVSECSFQVCLCSSVCQHKPPNSCPQVCQGLQLLFLLSVLISLPFLSHCPHGRVFLKD